MKAESRTFAIRPFNPEAGTSPRDAATIFYAIACW
jgi:hypothetical protein